VDSYVLGHTSAEGLPDAAVAALQEGFDSPTLRVLAGSDGEPGDELERLLRKALSELVISFPTPAEAGLSLARHVAAEVVRGLTSPYEGARRIWWDVYNRVPQLDVLRVFVGLASEYEDDQAHQEEYAQDIIEECRNLLASFA
jgi:hypothetical protein